MRILNENSDQALEKITLYLTLEEASELRDGLNELIKKPPVNHVHIADENFQKEITVCIYEKNNLNGFNERSIKLIKNNE